jgi:hypothetical protein
MSANCTINFDRKSIVESQRWSCREELTMGSSCNFMDLCLAVFTYRWYFLPESSILPRMLKETTSQIFR